MEENLQEKGENARDGNPEKIIKREGREEREEEGSRGRERSSAGRCSKQKKRRQRLCRRCRGAKKQREARSLAASAAAVSVSSDPSKLSDASMDELQALKTRLCIIGSGPAAHTTAIYAARAELKPILFEGWMANDIAPVDNSPPQPTSRLSLASLMVS